MGIRNSLDTWQTVAARKQAERLHKIPQEWLLPQALLPDDADTNDDDDDVSTFPSTSGFFTPRELELTNATASEVVRKIAKREWTSLEVTRAVCKRAAVAQQLVNCLTEICFDEALQRAEALDRKMSESGPVGPLHGLPISLKDQFHVPGLDTTIGYISRAEAPMRTASTLVELLLNAGAVLYAKTNVPATLMSGETVNNVFGRSLNPYNRKLTPGGSSGGESALVAFGGSYLGVGTDIGGSIRMPCHMTGIFGLRPSHGRVSYQNVGNTYVGQEAVISSAGPMCRSPEDIRLFMTSALAQKPWLQDPQCLPMPWRTEHEILPKKLCFGWSLDDDRVQATPPVRRALEIVRDKLLAAGHAVIEFKPHEMLEAQDISQKMLTADGGEEFQRETQVFDEPLHPEVEEWLRKSAIAAKTSVSETWQTQHRRTLFAQRWLQRWEETADVTGTGRPMDGLIMQTLPFPAVMHDSKWPSYHGALSPLLDLTTGSFPVTRVELEIDRVPTDWHPLSETDRNVMEFCELQNTFLFFFSSSFGNQWLGRNKKTHFDADTYTDKHQNFCHIFR